MIDLDAHDAPRTRDVIQGFALAVIGVFVLLVVLPVAAGWIVWDKLRGEK